MTTTIGNTIKAARIARGLTLQSVAASLGLTCRQQVYQWERGQVQPGPKHLGAANVAKYLQMSLDDARKPRNQAPQAMRPPEPPKSPRAGESDFQRQIRESRERGEIT